MRRLTTGLVAVSLALVAAGCGDNGGDGGSAGTSGASETTASSEAAGGGAEDAVAWADQVCSSIKDDIAALTTQPDLDLSNAQAAKDGVLAYLGQLETSLDGMASAVADAGTPPVDGGEDAVKGFTDSIATAKGAVSSAKTKIDAAPVNDPAGFQAAFGAAQEDLSKLGDLDPTTSLNANDELKKAYNEAPSCQDLENGSSTPTS